MSFTDNHESKEHANEIEHNDGEEPSTSGIKAEVSIRIKLKAGEKEDNSLHSLDELSELILKQNQIIEIDENESFITIEGCNHDIGTTTDAETLFSRDQRTQNVIVARSTVEDFPPPPYYDDRNYRRNNIGSTPIYVERYQGGSIPPRDASRAPPYRLNIDDDDPSYNVRDIFQDKLIRHRFIRKVYTILCFQLLFTFGFIALAIYVKKLKFFIIYNPIVMYIATGVFLIIYLILVCVHQARKKFPWNFFLLVLLTCAMAYVAAFISCYTETKYVLYAFGTTALVCLIITFIACQHWFDVTSCGVYLCLASSILIIYGIIAIIITAVTGSNIAYMIYTGLACILFSFYLLYDTQQILGGRRIELSPEEYILGAVTLYVDIINIFIDILTLFSGGE